MPGSHPLSQSLLIPRAASTAWPSWMPGSHPLSRSLLPTPHEVEGPGHSPPSGARPSCPSPGRFSMLLAPSARGRCCSREGSRRGFISFFILSAIQLLLFLQGGGSGRVSCFRAGAGGPRPVPHTHPGRFHPPNTDPCRGTQVNCQGGSLAQAGPGWGVLGSGRYIPSLRKKGGSPGWGQLWRVGGSVCFRGWGAQGGREGSQARGQVWKSMAAGGSVASPRRFPWLGLAPAGSVAGARPGGWTHSLALGQRWLQYSVLVHYLLHQLLFLPAQLVQLIPGG